MATYVYNSEFAGVAAYAKKASDGTVIGAATELTAVKAGLFSVPVSFLGDVIVCAGDIDSPLLTDQVVGFGNTDTIDVATLTDEVSALLAIVQSGLPVKNDPSRTFIIRRGKDIVGSDTVLTKKANDSAPFFADVRSLLGTNEHVLGTPVLSAEAGLTMGTAEVNADIITLPQSGGTAANAYEITVTFSTTKNATMVCTMTLGVI
jgi:hypothetical protein